MARSVDPPPAEETENADTQASPLEALTEPEPGPSSRREGPRAYASITGEGGHDDVATSASLGPSDDASRYEPGAILGQGGMGEVVLTLDHRIGRRVARKTLLSEIAGERTVSRFVREAKVQGQLEHPSIVPVYDFGVGERGLPYFTMKRVRGETLAHVLERLGEKDAAYTTRYSRHKLLAAFRQACLAVEYAHLRGVVHRDLKPSNIMLGDFGEVYVLDWGLAKLRADDEEAALSSRSPPVSDKRRRRSGRNDAEKTAEGDMIGTPAYMAPEQFGAGGSRFDTRQDVFALGAILFEILTLARYRPGASFATLLPSLLREADRSEPTRPSDKVAGVSPELDEACARALATEPTRRLASAGAIAEVIERYLDGDRDQEMRKALAGKLLVAAQLEATKSATPTAKLDAMRGAIKALALTPDDPVVQRFLLSLVVDGSGPLPTEAERELEVADFQVDAHTLRLALVGLASWFLTFPLAVWVGIRSYTIVALMAGLTLASMGYIALVLRWQTRAKRHVMVMASMLAATLSCGSAWLGPFILVPVATATIVMLFAVRSRRGERVGLAVIWALALLVPFVLELLHVVPPSYTFRDGELILHPRAFDLPEVPTLVALVYTSLGFMVLPMILLSRVRDRERDRDRRLFVQAWHLCQLFPDQSDAGERSAK